ncbi:MAG: sulfate transporter CysZ [Gammaproteobacteria bacterium]|nr:sulfate transporter CysZ [Gammaproteobacteria bacterium]
MSAGTGLMQGMRHALRGFRLITQPGVRIFVAIPLLINIVVFVLALSAAGMALDYGIDHYLAGWPEWTRWILWLILGLLAAITVFLTFSLLANLIAGPFNSMLAEAVEHHLNPQMETPAFSWSRLLNEAARSIRAELRKLFYIVLRALPLVVITLIPGVNVVAPMLWFLFGAWMLSMEYLDCPLGNHGRLFPTVIEEMRAQRRLALGFGGSITFLTIIPIVNFLAIPVGVAGATSMYCEHFSGNGSS